MVPVQLLPSALSEMFAQISTTGEITLADRYGMMAAILDETASEEDICAMDRLLHGIRRGRVQVVDKISAVAKP
jgi:hypothetical protein